MKGPAGWRKVRCLVCRQVNPRGLAACRHCEAKFPENRVPYEIKYRSTITDAFVQAEHIDTFKPAAFLLLTIAAAVVLIANVVGQKAFVWVLLFPLINCLISLGAIVHWIDKFAARGFEGEDFLSAFGKVRLAFWIWFAVMLAQVAGLLTLVRTR